MPWNTGRRGTHPSPPATKRNIDFCIATGDNASELPSIKASCVTTGDSRYYKSRITNIYINDKPISSGYNDNNSNCNMNHDNNNNDRITHNSDNTNDNTEDDSDDSDSAAYDDDDSDDSNTGDSSA
ncbi:unnamed protein product [Polarella glacialis]|uniref:Uncharacterized protein n=1 Tax=Polarella glacialis TaxID=89957 RepID=A0A813F0Y0_POLGL|nr:unnamed protein product [Polarella glacialis]